MAGSQFPPHDTSRSDKSKSIEDIAAEQGVSVPQDLSKLIGIGADLWHTDDELDAFLRGINQRKKGEFRAFLSCTKRAM